MSKTFIPCAGEAPSDFNAWYEHAVESENSAHAAIAFVAEPSKWHPMLENIQAKFSAIVYAAGEAAAYKVLGTLSPRRLALLNALFLAAHARGCEIDFDERRKVLTLKKWGASVEVLIRRMRYPTSRDASEPLEILVTAPAHFSTCIRDGVGRSVDNYLSHVFLTFYESVKDQCTVPYEERLQRWQASQDQWRAAIEEGKRQRAESAERRRAKKLARDLAKDEQRVELARILDEFRAQGVLPAQAIADQPQTRPAQSDAPWANASHGETASALLAPVRPRDQQELIDEATDYRQSQLVREYLLALNPVTPSGREWMLRANSLADAICPVTRRNAKLSGDAASS
jgi:hypothetical protein